MAGFINLSLFKFYHTVKGQVYSKLSQFIFMLFMLLWMVFCSHETKETVWVISKSKVEIHALSCPVVSSPLDSHFSCASKQY